MASTIVGSSGRVYVQGEVLQRRDEFSVFKAESGDESFVLKRTPRFFYDLALRVAADVAGSRRLRLHIDHNQEEAILVYPYSRCTLLALIREDPDFPLAERLKILRRVGEAIQELHSKDWIHIDVKPDNILVNWTTDEEGNKTVSDAVLGDFDIAFKSESGEPRQTPYAIGNVLWRSPEGQTGRGVTKASDIFSFGLVCAYTFGGGEYLIVNNSRQQELAKIGISLEEEVLIRHFTFFGPVSEGLLKQVNSEVWSERLKMSSARAMKVVEENPGILFQQWGEPLGPDALDMISGMTNPDPTARTTIDQVLAHRFWQNTCWGQ